MSSSTVETTREALTHYPVISGKIVNSTAVSEDEEDDPSSPVQYTIMGKFRAEVPSLCARLNHGEDVDEEVKLTTEMLELTLEVLNTTRAPDNDPLRVEINGLLQTLRDNQCKMDDVEMEVEEPHISTTYRFASFAE